MKSSRETKGYVGEAVAPLWPNRTGRRGKRGGRRALRVGKRTAEGRCAGDGAATPGERLGAVRGGVRRGGSAHGLRLAAARRRRAEPARCVPRGRHAARATR